MRPASGMMAGPWKRHVTEYHTVKQLMLRSLARLGQRLDLKHPLVPADIHNILIMQTGGLGDCLMLFPAIQALHDAFPLAAITLLTEQWPLVAPLFPLNQVIARSIVLDFQQRHRGIRGKLRLIRELRRHAFDLIYSPSRGFGMSENALLTWLMGAPYRLGFRQAGAGFSHTTSLELQPDQPLLTQNLALLTRAGITVHHRDIRVHIPEAAHAAVTIHCQRWGIVPQAQLIAVHPGASWQAHLKAWPLAHFAALIERLLHESHATIVLLGTASERAHWEHTQGALQHPRFINSMGQLTLTETAALLQRTRLFLGNDSGPLHLATALQVPAVAIFGATSPLQILTAPQVCTVVRTGIACSPCYIHQAFYTQPPCQIECLRLLTVDDVLAAITRTLPLRCHSA